MKIQISECELPKDWCLLEGQQSSDMNDELNKEMCKGHELYGLNFEALARKTDRDDFLFYVEGARSPLYIVHLTWSKETSPEWPWITAFESKDDFTSNWKRIYE